MNRRDALKTISLIFGGTIVGADVFLRGERKAVVSVLSEADVAFLDEVAETILPATEDSGGAKAAEIGSFMKEIVESTYSEKERTIFVAGIVLLDDFSEHRAGRAFMKLSPKERYGLLLELEAIESPEYYRMMKELTLWGYFSSKVGITEAFDYLPVPGRWEGCIEVGPDKKAWS